MKRKMNKGYYHEALDRTYVVCCIIDDYLLKHKAIDKHKTIKEKVLKAQELLADAYQDLGQFM